MEDSSKNLSVEDDAALERALSALARMLASRLAGTDRDDPSCTDPDLELEVDQESTG